MFKSFKIGLMLSAALISQLAAAEPTKKLKLNLGNEMTVSGISSGGYMANQYHIAHSATVKGAGIIAAGPYYCAEGTLMTAMKQCLADGSLLADVELSEAISQAYKAGTIDSPASLSSDKVWLLHGTLDNRVAETVTDGLYQQYLNFIENTQIRYIRDKAFNHALPTKDFGIDCKETAPPFVANCHYDAAGDMLAWLYPQAKASGVTGGTIHQIEQPLAVDDKSTGLAENGYIYVPEQCVSGTSCQLHVSFHGCQQNVASIGKVLIENGGFNAAADRLNLVIFYPQTASGTPLNPLGCWDWWGYTSSDYHTQNGAQIKAITQTINLLSQGDIGYKGAMQ